MGRGVTTCTTLFAISRFTGAEERSSDRSINLSNNSPSHQCDFLASAQTQRIEQKSRGNQEAKEEKEEEEDDFPWEKETEERGKGGGGSKGVLDSNKVEQRGELVHRNTHVETKNAEAALDWAAQRGGKSLRDDANTGFRGGGADSISLLISGSPSSSPVATPLAARSAGIGSGDGVAAEDQANAPLPSPALQPTEFNGKHVDGFDEFMATSGMKTTHDLESRGSKLPLSILRAPEITMRGLPTMHAIASQSDAAYPGNPYLDMSTTKSQRKKRRKSSFMLAQRGELGWMAFGLSRPSREGRTYSR